MKGYAPGWQVRCLKCGLTLDAADLGWIRIRAAGRSYKLLWCQQCGRFRCFAMERKPPDVPEPAGPRSQLRAYYTADGRLVSGPAGRPPGK